MWPDEGQRDRRDKVKRHMQLLIVNIPKMEGKGEINSSKFKMNSSLLQKIYLLSFQD